MSTSCNAEIAKSFLGVWRPILREMLTLHAKHLNKKKEFILNSYLNDSDIEDSKY